VARLEAFEPEWGRRYSAISQIWRRAWEQVVLFVAFAPAIPKMICTTNAVEALHRSLGKIIKTRRESIMWVFPGHSPRSASNPRASNLESCQTRR